MSELDIERLKTDPAYRAERAALRNGTRKPIETQQPEPIVQPQPIINAHMAPADRAHWDMMNDWFQRSFATSFEKNFEAHLKPYLDALADEIVNNHVDTLLVASMLNSILGIHKNSLRPDVTLNDVRANLDRLREEIGITARLTIEKIDADEDGEEGSK